MDATLLAAAAAEVQARAVGARLERVTQPGPAMLLLHLWGADPEARLLLIAVQPPLARVHLTWRRRENPPHPPSFCQVLRRHLEGARLAAVAQPGLERVLYLDFLARDELGNPATKRLVVELIGQRSDVLLLAPDGRVLDALRQRENLGRPYLPPPPQPGKLDPTRAGPAEIESALARGRPAEVLLGVSPRLARELERTSAGEAARLAAEVLDTVTAARSGRVTPLLARAWGLPEDTGREVGRACDAAFGEAEAATALGAERQRLLDVLRSQAQRLERKLAKQEEELRQAERADELRLWGELLLAHLGEVRRGADEAVLPAFDEPSRLVRVPLDPRLSPAANAQATFRRYRKAQRAQDHLQGQLEAARAEQAYLADAERAARQAESLADIRALADELVAEGYLKPPPHGAPRQGGGPRSEPLRLSVAGWTVLVGKNARQNDWLTMRQARPDDWWLHARGLPGSHVLLRPDGGGGGEPPPEVLHRAASLAAYYSAARQGSHVAVDCTQRRHVWKPRGARPGFVLYDHERGLSVDPAPP